MKIIALAITLSSFPLACLLQARGQGSALEFDGTGGYVSIATTGSLSGTFTVEVWAKPYDNSATCTLCVLGSRRPWDFSFDFIFWQGSLLHGDLGNNYTWITTSANAPFPYSINTWYHLAEVVTPTNYTIYVDGSTISTGSYAPDSPLLYDDNHQLVIGNFGIDLPGYTGDEYMNGQIAEVRIWNTARTSPEIQTNAFRTLSGSEPGLVGYWRFDEGTGMSLRDATGHGFDGTIIPSFVTGPTWTNSSFQDEKLLIINQPESQIVPAGTDLRLNVGVFGAEPLKYRWQFNSANLRDATNATLSLPNVQPSASGLYSVIVTNGAGSVQSQDALIKVVAPRLQIDHSGDLVFLWWPSNAAGFVLEASTNLGQSQSWSPFGAPVLIIGDQKVTAFEITPGRKFFRLHKQ